MTFAFRTPAGSILALVTAVLLGAGITYIIFEAPGGRGAPEATEARVKPAPECSYTIARADGFTHVGPLLFSEPTCPSPRFEGLRHAISVLDDSLRSEQVITSMSVHVRDFRRGEWTVHNAGERFDPGSLLKVPLMMCYMAMAQEDPALLKRTYRCEDADASVPQYSAFPDVHATPGGSYTVEQLLDLSVIHSDNRATVMLLRHMSPERYVRFFTDLGLPPPDWGGQRYPLGVVEFSVFMKALYNASVLGPIVSEHVLDMLTRSSFREGLVAGLPPDVEVAHKFGEAGDPSERQLHESGIVYLQGHPYLISVMTRGGDTRRLAGAIAAVARLVHTHMSSN